MFISSADNSLSVASLSKTLKVSPGYTTVSDLPTFQYLNCWSSGAAVFGAGNATASALSAYIFSSPVFTQFALYTTFIPSAQSILLLHLA